MITTHSVSTYQPTATRALTAAFARKRLPHALIFAGNGDEGEDALALRVAQSLLCPHLRGPFDPCGTCNVCTSLQNETHPDLHTIRPKGLLHAIRTDDVLAMIQALQTTTLAGEAKIAIIYDAETVRKESANRLLKTVEEPPPSTYFIFLTARIERLLPTIRSRCHILRMSPLPLDIVAAHTHEQSGVSNDDARTAAQLARGRTELAMHIASDLSDYIERVQSLCNVFIARDKPTCAADTARDIAAMIKNSRATFEDECARKISAKNKELADAETATRRAIVKEYEDELKAAQSAFERGQKADVFDILMTLWRDVWVYHHTQDDSRLVFSCVKNAIHTLATLYTPDEVQKNIYALSLVRGPTVFLNARFDVVLTGVFLEATQPVHAATPLRSAVAATGL